MQDTNFYCVAQASGLAMQRQTRVSRLPRTIASTRSGRRCRRSSTTPARTWWSSSPSSTPRSWTVVGDTLSSSPPAGAACHWSSLYCQTSSVLANNSAVQATTAGLSSWTVQRVRVTVENELCVCACLRSKDQMKTFGGETPYSVMFGPDICGYATQKVCGAADLGPCKHPRRGRSQSAPQEQEEAADNGKYCARMINQAHLSLPNAPCPVQYARCEARESALLSAYVHAQVLVSHTQVLTRVRNASSEAHQSAGVPASQSCAGGCGVVHVHTPL